MVVIFLKLVELQLVELQLVECKSVITYERLRWIHIHADTRNSKLEIVISAMRVVFFLSEESLLIKRA